MHTPAKGAGLNKGLGGSNPPFSAKTPSQEHLLLAFFLSISLFFRRFEAISGKSLKFDVKS